MSAAILGVAGPSPLWYLTRGTGLVALILLTVSVVLGVATTGRWAPRGWSRFATAGLHRNVSLLVMALLGVHIVTAELDTFAPVGWLAAGVPFVSAYRPIWVGLGTVAFDLLIAVTVTSLLRARIGLRTWRAVHWAAYLSWPSALVHGLGTGSDPRLRWVQALTVACVVAVMAAVAWRLGRGWRVAPGRRALAAGGLVVASIVVSQWTASGPLHAGWARRSGTPAALLGSHRSTGAAAAAPVAPPAGGTRTDTGSPWSADLSGTLHEQGPDPSGQVTITIAGRLSGGRTGALRLVLAGRSSGGGVTLQTSAVDLDLSGGRHLRGRVDALNGDQLAASVGDDAGARIRLAVNLRIDPSTRVVTGTVAATPAGSSPGAGT